jgi:hypothetical protein
MPVSITASNCFKMLSNSKSSPMFSKADVCSDYKQLACTEGLALPGTGTDAASQTMLHNDEMIRLSLTTWLVHDVCGDNFGNCAGALSSIINR